MIQCLAGTFRTVLLLKYKSIWLEISLLILLSISWKVIAYNSSSVADLSSLLPTFDKYFLYYLCNSDHRDSKNLFSFTFTSESEHLWLLRQTRIYTSFFHSFEHFFLRQDEFWITSFTRSCHVADAAYIIFGLHTDLEFKHSPIYKISLIPW